MQPSLLPNCNLCVKSTILLKNSSQFRENYEKCVNLESERPGRDAQSGPLLAEAHLLVAAEQVQGEMKVVGKWGYRNGAKKLPQHLDQALWLFSL